MVKINLSQKLTEANILIQIRKAAQLTEQINEVIRSRENYRIINEGKLDNYSSRRATYNEIVLNQREFDIRIQPSSGFEAKSRFA